MDQYQGRLMHRAVTTAAGVLLAVVALAGVVFAGGKGGASGGGGGALSTVGTVAFTGNSSDPGVWVCAPDGSGLRLLTPPGETWFSDDVSRGPPGTPVTVLSRIEGGTRLYALRADGTGTPALIHEMAFPARLGSPRFSLDGTRVAFIGNSGVILDEQGQIIWGLPILYSIYVGDVVRDTSGEVTGLANVQSVYDTYSQLFRGLDFTRSGDEIVFVMDHDLWVLDLATGAATQLTATSEVEASPRCSPNDERVVYERWPDAASMGKNGVICTLDVPTGAVTTVTTKKNGGLPAAYLSYPCWSPDGGVILFNAHDSRTSDLWQVASDGSGKAVNATNNGAAVWENYPAWGWLP